MTAAGGLSSCCHPHVQRWLAAWPAFVIKNSTATLCGINERNFNCKPVTLWVRETQQGDTRETTKLPWVYLSHLLREKP